MDRVGAELSDAKKTVQDLALKIEEANSRAKGKQRKPKWCEREDPETSFKNSEDSRYKQLMKELELMKQELHKLKLDMQRVLKEKKRAERASKASSSKTSALSASVGLINDEIRKLGEEQVLVELARIEAIKDQEAIEAQRKEDENRYKTRLSEAKMAQELQITLHDVNLLENELNFTRNQDGSGSIPLDSIVDELKAVEMELVAVKREGFEFMTSMDVIRSELKHVRDEKDKLQKAEEKRDLTVQNLNSKIIRARAKLEAVTNSEKKTSIVASNLTVALEQLREESEKPKYEKELLDFAIENEKREIAKTESEIESEEERLEAEIEELKKVKSSESKALRDLRDTINARVKAREADSVNGSTITITGFEYDYLLGKARVASEIADKKIAAAQAWVEALKANEKEISMKVEITRSEIEALEEADMANRTDLSELRKSGKTGPKVAALPRRSMYRVGKTGGVRRASLQRLRTPAGRFGPKSGSFRNEKVLPNVASFFGHNDDEMSE